MEYRFSFIYCSERTLVLLLYRLLSYESNCHVSDRVAAKWSLLGFVFLWVFRQPSLQNGQEGIDAACSALTSVHDGDVKIDVLTPFRPEIRCALTIFDGKMAENWKIPSAKRQVGLAVNLRSQVIQQNINRRSIWTWGPENSMLNAGCQYTLAFNTTKTQMVSPI